MSTTSELLAENTRLRLAITGDGYSHPPTTTDCVVIAEQMRKRSERRRRLLYDVGQFLSGILTTLREDRATDRYDTAADLADAALGLSIPDHGLQLTDLPTAPVSEFTALLMSSIGQAAAPGELLSPTQLIARIEAYRLHSETLHMVDAILRGEPLTTVTPMPADVVPEVMDEIIDLVSGHMAALRACADALAAMRSTVAAYASDAARSSAEDDLPHV